MSGASVGSAADLIDAQFILKAVVWRGLGSGLQRQGSAATTACRHHHGLPPPTAWRRLPLATTATAAACRNGTASWQPARSCGSGLAPRPSILRNTSGATLKSLMPSLMPGGRWWRQQGEAR